MLTDEHCPLAILAGMLNSVGRIQQRSNGNEPAFDLSAVQTICSEARRAWASAVFEPTTADSLCRYFTLQLSVLYRISENRIPVRYGPETETELFCLADHLYLYYQQYIDAGTPVPTALVKGRVALMETKISVMKSQVVGAIKDDALLLLLEDIFEEFSSLESVNICSAGTLVYAEKLIEELYQVLKSTHGGDTTSRLIFKLTELNFNHIQFFLYLEDRLRARLCCLAPTGKLEVLRGQKHYYDQLVPVCFYNRHWRAIGEMMKGWIDEETGLCLAEPASEPETAVATLGFNLSVAQLACLTKTFHKAGLYLTENIGQVLNFSSRHFHSKQQSHISRASFSKEYYSVSQKTAAQMLQLLQKMAAGIKRDYFPLIFAVSAMHFLL